MEQVGVRPNGEELRIAPRSYHRRQAPPANKGAIALPRPGRQQTPPRMAVTVTFTAAIVCMSRCMVRGSDPECRLGAHRRAAAVTSRFTAGQQFQ